MYDASYVRLAKRLVVLPHSPANGDVVLKVTGNNLFVLTNFIGLEPELTATLKTAKTETSPAVPTTSPHPKSVLSSSPSTPTSDCHEETSLHAILVAGLPPGVTQCRWLEVDPEQYILAEDALKPPKTCKLCSSPATTCWPTFYDGDVQLINELRGDNVANRKQL